MKIDGKSFSPEKNVDPTRFFGKTVFAHKVVRPNAKHIDFSGFEPLLKTIVQIQKDYAKRHAGATASVSTVSTTPASKKVATPPPTATV